MVREKDEWLICDEPRGGRHCGGRVGFVNEIKGHRELLMPPGWKQGRDRIWHEPPRAQWIRSQGFPSRPLPAAISGKKRSRGATWRAPMFMPNGTRWTLRVRCSDCQHVHELDARALGVARLTKQSMVTEGAHKAP